MDQLSHRKVAYIGVGCAGLNILYFVELKFGIAYLGALHGLDLLDSNGDTRVPAFCIT